MKTPTFSLRRGRVPMLVSMPHVGTVIPSALAADMTPVAARVDDTDWHLERLYDFLESLGVSILVPSHSRYVIDLNRPPDNVNLYPGQDTTGLCPIDTFDKEPLYAPGRAPDEAAIFQRVATYWQPYHTALQEELARIHAQHGRALLWDAHSIRSQVPRFFDGRLPDFNFGTAGGASCGPGLGERLRDIVATHGVYSTVLNDRFKGGYITRQYGRPAQHIHAVQLELSQITYMQETLPYGFDETRAAAVRPVLHALVEAMLAWPG
ncbi:N-formylglutamate amidohydrolase [Pandoraea thiooxydans]|uniref:N-formylglutamate deformylase n=1 Tax=Pandoraea thiooxydans TaxID=445709 RepID=A0A0G3ELY9_9BURK|nr:N-formylglutamate deformylase [Pandoraea thiooxydans]AKJ67960.1 N-formylglutamate deformylase [Pandoraea thiooxydans]APR95174.1 N-formylglutamate amidohydrolase [Pandoraea thiooxydans]